MTTLDTQVLSQLQNHLVETANGGASWASALWTVQEVIDYLNERQRAFLKETQILLTRATIPAIPMIQRHALPVDWVATARVVWRDANALFTEIPRSDGFEADHATADWPYNSAPKPSLYMDTETPTLLMQTAPAASDAGQLQILYVALTTLLSNSGVAFAVPDEFVPALKYGVLADMLSKDGRAQDLARAAYCETRYQEGVAAAKIILRGWS